MIDLYAKPTEWRLEKIIHLNSVLNSDGMTDDLMDMISSIDPNDLKPSPIFQQLPFMTEIFLNCPYGQSPEDDNEYFWGAFYAHDELTGFFIQIAAKIPAYSSEKISSTSWVYYQTRWVYVPTIYEAELMAAALSDELHLLAKEKFAENVKARKAP